MFPGPSEPFPTTLPYQSDALRQRAGVPRQFTPKMKLSSDVSSGGVAVIVLPEGDALAEVGSKDGSAAGFLIQVGVAGITGYRDSVSRREFLYG